jgi:hypothetical protein
MGVVLVGRSIKSAGFSCVGATSHMCGFFVFEVPDIFIMEMMLTIAAVAGA